MPTITTIGHLAPQETTNVQSSDLQRGDTVRLKAAKPVNEKPYGLAEVLAVLSDNSYKVRRVS